MSGGPERPGIDLGPIRAPRWAVRTAFFLFAAALHTATHIPRLEIPEIPVPDSDKLLHLGAFMAWSVLLVGSGFFGPPLSRRNLLACWLLGLAVGGLDEWTQGLRWVRRDASWGDWAADAAGVTAVTAVAAWRGRKTQRSGPVSPAR